MFKADNPKIRAFAAESADNLMQVALMVSLSIQQDWASVGKQLQDVKTKGIDSRFVWGGKQKSYKYMATNKHKLYAQMMAVLNSNKSDDDRAYSLMKVFLRIDGLGMVKAGFLCQLVGGVVGCIDVHNIRAYNISPKILSMAKNPKTIKGLETNKRKVLDYIKICHDIGTEELWDNWCNNLAVIHKKKWVDGRQVSKVHYDYLMEV